MGHAGHRDLLPGGERDVQGPGGRGGVFVESFVEVAQPKQQNAKVGNAPMKNPNFELPQPAGNVQALSLGTAGLMDLWYSFDDRFQDHVAEASTVAVSGATVHARPRPNTITAGSTVVT